MEIGCVIGKVVAQCPSCIYDCLRCDAENARKEARTGKRLSPSPLDRGRETGFNVHGLGFTFDDEKTNGAALSGRGSGFVTADPGSK